MTQPDDSRDDPGKGPSDGRIEPEHTRVVRSVPALDAAALSAVGQWRFTPALGHQGRPVRVIVEIPVNFSLK